MKPAGRIQRAHPRKNPTVAQVSKEGSKETTGKILTRLHGVGAHRPSSEKEREMNMKVKMKIII